MAFIIDFSCSQSLDCKIFKLTDISTGYQGASFELACSSVPGSPVKNNIGLQITSPFINDGDAYLKNIIITNGMTSSQVAGAIYNALLIDTDYSTVFDISINSGFVNLVAKKDFMFATIELVIESSSDFSGVSIMELTVALPNAATRSVEITFSDATVETIPFPFIDGADDFIEIPIVKDYTMSIKLIIGVYDKTFVYIATCNTDTYYRNLAAELDNRLDNGECSDCILGIMERIDNYKNSAVSYASIDTLSLSQEFLNRIPAVYDLDCVCN